MKNMSLKTTSIISLFICCCLLFSSCSKTKNEKVEQETKERTQRELSELLTSNDLPPESRYTVINQIATNLREEGRSNELIIFLTSLVEQNPNDIYNSYWLLMIAYIYMQEKAEPVAEYYFERIIQNYQDLIVENKSIHLICLQNLIQISTSPANKITYFNKLISQFPDKVSETELYYRLALEYEKLGDWDMVLKSYNQFLEQPDASTIQIVGASDAYSTARKLIDFSNSSKDWTFESLDALESAVKSAISRYSAVSLDRYKSKVNFFAMSWKQDATDENSQGNFSMRSFMMGNRIRYSDTLDESSNPNEAYLRTWGWSQYISVWYLYFRKVNFPVDPEIHGRWEWAGIYFGEKL